MDGIGVARGDVVAVVQAYAGDRRSVRLSDELMYDLHIDGDTAEELLGSIGQRFGTRLEVSGSRTISTTNPKCLSLDYSNGLVGFSPTASRRKHL